MTRDELLGHLAQQINRFITITQTRYSVMDESTLNRKSNSDSWSLLECFEHMNRYCRYYNPELLKALNDCPNSSGDSEIRSTWLGRKFIKMMDPSNAKKQKTLKRMNPINSRLPASVVEEFKNHQIELDAIIRMAATEDINPGKVPVEFLRLLNLNVADTLRFVILHQQRHFLQLQRILQMNGEPVLKV
jgi:hypothetical protein